MVGESFLCYLIVIILLFMLFKELLFSNFILVKKYIFVKFLVIFVL